MSGTGPATDANTGPGTRPDRLWHALGAHPEPGGGVRFSVWAPNARRVQVDGDFNDWDAYQAVDLDCDWTNGRWSGFAPKAEVGDRYKFRVLGADGRWQTRADPFAFQAETPPATASVIAASDHEWGDREWLAARRRNAEADLFHRPMSVYEVHLPSWRPGLDYRGLADHLVAHVAALGFTHVEFLPVMEHPFGGSWGYQTTGFFAPTARLGDPDGLRLLVDRFHQAGIGVLFDWVPAHFPGDDWALARFDGTALYEHADPRRAEHPDWGSLVFNFGRWEVRDFLIASALYWIEEFHADGVRVDAVSSMLYLDYSRQPGQWEPNVFGGNGDLDAIDFLRALTGTIRGLHPDVLEIAEESAAWPGVSAPPEYGGLGFHLKWNLGWMHDTLDYVVREPVFRRYHHDELMRPTTYAYTERFLLTLSHDEVVHGKQSLASKLPGDRGQQVGGLRGLYAYQWAFPGKQLVFMGAEFAQRAEWSEERGLDWGDADGEDARGLMRLLGDLNRVYSASPALWARESDPLAVRWPMADRDANVVVMLRFGPDGDALACVVNFSGITQRDYRIGLPWAGVWSEVVNTDAREYGGGGEGNLGAVHAVPEPLHGEPASAAVTVAPGAAVWLASRY